MSVTILQKTSNVAMGALLVDVKGEAVEVLVVGKPETGEFGSQISEGRFYLSPMIARTAYKDLDKGAKLLPVFQGRSFGEMKEHLVKNAK